MHRYQKEEMEVMDLEMLIENLENKFKYRKIQF